MAAAKSPRDLDLFKKYHFLILPKENIVRLYFHFLLLVKLYMEF